MKKVISIIMLLIIFINVPVLYNFTITLTYDYRNFGTDMFTKNSFYETYQFQTMFKSQLDSLLVYISYYRDDNYNQSFYQINNGQNHIDFIIYVESDSSDNESEIITYTNLLEPNREKENFYNSKVFYHNANWKDNKKIESSFDILKDIEINRIAEEYEIYFSCDEEIYEPYEDRFKSAKNNFYFTIGISISIIVAFIYKTISYIKQKKEKKDKWYIELIALIIFLTIIIKYNIFISFGYYSIIYYIFYIVNFIIFINFYRIILQKIKSKTIIQSFYILNIIKNIKLIYKIVFLVVLILSINLIAIFNFLGSTFAFIVTICDIIISAYVIKLFIEYKNICESIQKIANGNLNEKMETNSRVFKELTKDINNISNGMSNALEQNLKSERLKTDLITNVSHDLKTPLTSIINYINLMKKEKIQDEKMSKYISVLDEKSLKLKNLTDDLIEISKITSGNEKLVLEELNIAEMVMQANGEFAEKFSTKNLEIISKIGSNNLFIKLDGKKMWRVLENLYTNVYKYSLENTRVYVELNKKNDLVNFSMKNISKQELNITPEELMERFVRGDSSRNTEGSGLRIVNSKTSCRATRRYI